MLGCIVSTEATDTDALPLKHPVISNNSANWLFIVLGHVYTEILNSYGAAIQRSDSLENSQLFNG